MTDSPILIDANYINKRKDNAIGAVVYPTLITFLVISIVMIMNPTFKLSDTLPFLPLASFGMVELFLPVLVFIIAAILYRKSDKKNTSQFDAYFPILKKEIQAKYNIDITIDEAKRIISKEEFIKIASIDKYVYFTLKEKSKHQFALTVTMNASIPVPYQSKT